jgi:hypothetical protein
VHGRSCTRRTGDWNRRCSACSSRRINASSERGGAKLADHAGFARPAAAMRTCRQRPERNKHDATLRFRSLDERRLSQLKFIRACAAVQTFFEADRGSPSWTTAAVIQERPDTLPVLSASRSQPAASRKGAGGTTVSTRPVLTS